MHSLGTLLKLLALASLALTAATPAMAIEVTDDSGRTIRLINPARRIISLAPHITELLFAAGAGKSVIAAVDYSDFPDTAKGLPRVGDNERLDLERIAALKPDLLIVWLHGAAQRQLAQLRKLGIPVFHSEPRSLADVARTLENFGMLAGTNVAADAAALEYRRRLNQLVSSSRNLPLVPVFIQIWDGPPMTVNDRHLISDAVRLCGGRNVFGTLPALAPAVSAEAVIAANPEAIVATGMASGRADWLNAWKSWPRLTAVSRGNLFAIAPELITRHTPRILDGVEQLCAQLAVARRRR